FDWELLALAFLVVHLPIAVMEGVVLGFTVGFLARVKPELIGWPAPVYWEAPPADDFHPSANGVADEAITKKQDGIRPGGPLLLAVLIMISSPSIAHAHRLEAQAAIRPWGQIQVESWFEGGESAEGARIAVYCGNGKLLTEGRINDKGIFLFAYSDV